MKTVIIDREQILQGSLARLLPPELLSEIAALLAPGERVEDICLRLGRAASIKVEGRHIRLSATFSAAEMEQTLLRLCGGSVYAHAESIKAGYLTLPSGVRVGLCGRALRAGERITGVSDIAALCIRIPHGAPPVGQELCTWFEDAGGNSGLLIYGPPGVGKTTLLCGMAGLLAGGAHPRKVALIDTGGEMAPRLPGRDLLLDVLTGYPRAAGIALAARTLAADVMISDEIGEEAEAREMASVLHCGVPFIASAHGDSLKGLLSRPGLQLLHRAGVFGAYVALARGETPFTFRYRITTREEAHAVL